MYYAINSIVFIITAANFAFQYVNSAATIDLRISPANIKYNFTYEVDCEARITNLEVFNYVVIYKDNQQFYKMVASTSAPIITLVNGISYVEYTKTVGQVRIRNAVPNSAGIYTCILNYRVKANNQTFNISTIKILNYTASVQLTLTPAKFKKNETTFVNCIYSLAIGNTFDSLTLAKDSKNFASFYANQTHRQFNISDIKSLQFTSYIGQVIITADSKGQYTCRLVYKDSRGAQTTTDVFSNDAISNRKQSTLSLIISSLLILLASKVFG